MHTCANQRLFCSTDCVDTWLRRTGLDTTVAFGPSGQGLTSTVLHDVDGPVGHAQQIRTVRPLSGA